MQKWANKWALHAAVAVTCASAYLARGATTERAIVPTVHPTLTPTSAIQVPMQFSADQTSVWRGGQEQRMLLSGRVNVAIGYRQLKADNAAVWLTPSREGGEGVYDVAVYLSGHVQVKEGSAAAATTTGGNELLVTTRISQSVQLVGQPVSKAEQDSPIVKRGDELRQEVLNRPALVAHIPRIVITPSEQALQAGWIAKGPNNRIIAGPGEIRVVRDEQGNVISPPVAVVPAKPKPPLFVTGDAERTEELADEIVHILPNAYVFSAGENGRPGIEFRAQRVVVFTPKAKAEAATQPGGGAASKPAAKDISQQVTGIYLEGDVTLDQGDQLTVRAERLYYDTASNRAIMLDATLSTVDEVLNLPIYLRAKEIRQLAAGEFAAKKATFSTSEFYTPHYHVGASEAYLRDMTPELEGPQGGTTPGGLGAAGLGVGGSGGRVMDRTYKFELKDTTLDVQGLPIFYWPMLAGDTSKNTIPLRTIRVSNSKTYGLTLLTDWDLFGLAGQTEPKGVRADLNLDYYGKRGPAGGVQSNWMFDDDHGILRSYALLEQGTDRLGTDRPDVIPNQDTRGRITLRDQRDLGDGLTLQLEGSYISDPTFLEQFFHNEFAADKEQETSVYLKKQGETDALTFLGKFNLMDFTATADQIDDQFTTEKKPEIKYWRIGDSFFDMFTYYSESGGADVRTKFSNYSPTELGLFGSQSMRFLGVPALAAVTTQEDALVALNASQLGQDKTSEAYLAAKGAILAGTFRRFYRGAGLTDQDVLRGDTRQEIDMPLKVGDVKVTPYLTGRLTAWDDSFPEGNSGNTTRLWGSAGVRSSMQFWHVYNDVQSTFFDVNRLRHVIEPQFNMFVSGSNQDRSELQLFDRDVEGISRASGTQLSLNQKWQTKRPGGPDTAGAGRWRDVDWITLNVSWNQFFNRDRASIAYPLDPVRGFMFASRPELSLVQNSINVDGTWRAGEHFRFLGEATYSLESNRIEQAAAGIAVDQAPNLSYFFGNRYINALGTDEWTIAMDYQLTQKYRLIASESYDFEAGSNILSSLTLIRKMPRLNAAVTVTYDANNADTSFVFTLWPEGFPNAAFGNEVGSTGTRR